MEIYFTSPTQVMFADPDDFPLETEFDEDDEIEEEEIDFGFINLI